MSSLDIYLVRHGESEMQTPHNKRRICGRYPNTPLTELGRSQAALLGERFAREQKRFHKIITSPTVRSYNTIDIVRHYVGYPSNPILEDALHESDKGVFDGKVRKHVVDAMPGIEEEIARLGVTFRLPGGESMTDVGLRGIRWLAQETAACEVEPYSILAGSHSGFISCLIWWLFDMDDDTVLNPKIVNTSVTHLSFDGTEWILNALNDHSHLPKEAFVD